MVKVNNNLHLRNSTPFKSATFCSGIGSSEQSLKELNANHINVFACEKDKFARQTYLANFTPGIMLEDMTTESYDDPELYADLVVAGIPCQSFSLAGKRKGENDPRGLLIYDFIRYVKKRRPKVFIIENVKGLLSDAGGVTFGKWLELLGRSRNGQENMFNHPDTLGYNLHYRVLNAKHYGLPQNRERVFIIGIRRDLPGDYRWPKRVVLKDRLIDLLESEVDEKYYLSDAALKYIVQDSGNWSDRLSMMDSSNAMVSGSITANHSKGVPYNMLKLVGLKSSGFDTTGRIDSAGGISPAIPSVSGGGYNSPLVMQLNQSKESGGVQPYQQNRVYDSNGIAPALDSKAGVYGIMVNEATKQGFAIAENGDSINFTHPNSNTRKGLVGKQVSQTVDSKPLCVIDNYRIRRYTPLECMRLMGYPDYFIKPCSETQTYKQAGNSIPVHMMKAVLKPLLPLLENS